MDHFLEAIEIDVGDLCRVLFSLCIMSQWSFRNQGYL